MLARQKKSYLTCVEARNSELLRKYVIFSVVSVLCSLSQFCTLKKDRNRLREYPQICHFNMYQIVFLLTCQPHWSNSLSESHCTLIKNKLSTFLVFQTLFEPQILVERLLTVPLYDFDTEFSRFMKYVYTN